MTRRITARRNELRVQQEVHGARLTNETECLAPHQAARLPRDRRSEPGRLPKRPTTGRELHGDRVFCRRVLANRDKPQNNVALGRRRTSAPARNPRRSRGRRVEGGRDRGAWARRPGEAAAHAAGVVPGHAVGGGVRGERRVLRPRRHRRARLGSGPNHGRYPAGQVARASTPGAPTWTSLEEADAVRLSRHRVLKASEQGYILFYQRHEEKGEAARSRPRFIMGSVRRRSGDPPPASGVARGSQAAYAS